MINNNRKYDYVSEGEKQRSNRRLLFAQRTFVILGLTLILTSGFLIFSIMGKLKARDNDVPIVKALLVSPTTVTEETEVPQYVVTPVPTPYIIEELLPTSDLLDEYWGPLVPKENPLPHEHFNVKGLYVSDGAFIEDNINTIANSELNAVVLDLKEIDGVYYNSSNETALSIGGGYVHSAFNLQDVCDMLHEEDIYVIGRIVCFKDLMYTNAFPERAICDANGNPLFFSGEGSASFASPYNQDNWDYLIELAIEAISMGVDEIQFDYVRFPTGGTTSGESPYFGEEGVTPTKIDAINRFLQTARIAIQDSYGVPLSADVFGIAVTSTIDGQILGQDFATIGLTGVDSVCPMAYPSHFALGTMLGGYVFEKPDREPYNLLYTLFATTRRIYTAEGYTVVRPYLQAFTAAYIGEGNYLEYDYDAINDQIRALQEVGIDEFILWNASAYYPDGAYDGVDSSIE